jgi:hypothetical protein
MSAAAAVYGALLAAVLLLARSQIIEARAHAEAERRVRAEAELVARAIEQPRTEWAEMCRAAQRIQHPAARDLILSEIEGYANGGQR